MKFATNGYCVLQIFCCFDVLCKTKSKVKKKNKRVFRSFKYGLELCIVFDIYVYLLYLVECILKSREMFQSIDYN